MDRESTVNQQAMKAKNQQKSGSLEEYIRKCRIVPSFKLFVKR